MEIHSDKYILGQSINKTIEDSQKEIRLDLSLQPNTTELLLGPQYDSFTVIETGQVPPIEINATQGILGGGASIAPNGQFVQGLGVSFGADVSVIIYTIVAGNYNLKLQYLSGNQLTTLLINVAGAATGTTYRMPKTTNWDVGNANTVTIPLTLAKGRNLIKFYNNSGTASPWIGNLKFLLKTSSTISMKAGSGNVVGPAFVLANGYVGAIGDNGGYVTVTVNAPKSSVYTLGIQYLSGDTATYINRTLKIDVNGVNTGSVYTFPNTGNWDLTSSQIYDVDINLNQGNNTVKFYNSPNYPGPWIDVLTFTRQFFYQTIEAENCTLEGTAKVIDRLVGGIAYGLGSISFGATVPAGGSYDLIIRYVSTISGRTARIFINGVYTGTTYTFDVTDDWDIYKYKTIAIQLNNIANLIKMS
ncbi:hypothetical protein [Clostridium botulinum]|uniref:hypothetical protein n=1 Tax=Clostridium botulinum TaxID=1491 RepID=UPI0004D3FD47|nr:hypothetical protein [Clostridium botulinum]KEI00027.1 hypothetical protein Z952_14480 [Clostridium botulinum C/D str. BKT75002]KEI05811.1 hypothetical protein Z954_14635 [Clostridium botulinum C/D str. BKT2873]KOC45935.1 hypothetical protein ADU88_12935 [Clostridium botulinum]MCD3351506.1 hypothetical protein [Clostridium botulinum D/C]MCD3360462.1 hypothetical protein [Clostridium botulinum D/C]